MPREKAQVAITTRPKVPMRRLGADCLVVVMKRDNGRGAKGAGHRHWRGSTGNGRNPLINGRRQPSCDGTSRISREAYVRFCERLGVKFPGPTRLPLQGHPEATTSHVLFARKASVGSPTKFICSALAVADCCCKDSRSSLSNRVFSMAMTACLAKFSSMPRLGTTREHRFKRYPVLRP